MSSTPQTGGFHIGAIPQLQYANPALFNPYGQLSDGISQGIDMSGKLQDIQLRKQMNARQQQQMEMEQQMQQARLNDIQYGVEQRPALEEERRLRLQALRQAAQLSAAEQPGKMAEAGQPHIFKDQDQTEKVINPQTGDLEEWVRRAGVFENGDPWHEFTPKKVLKTKEELSQDAETHKANVSYKTNAGEAGRARAEAARLAAEWNREHPNASSKIIESNGLLFSQKVDKQGNRGPMEKVLDPDGNQVKAKQSELSKTNALFEQLLNGGALVSPAANPAPVSPAANPAPVDTGKAVNPVAAAAVAKIITSQAEYNALDSGTIYIDASTGARARKR